MPGIHTNWGKIFRDIRVSKGLSQRELAELADVNRSSLRRFEDGLTSGNMEMLEGIAFVLGCEFELMDRAPSAR